MNSRIQQGSNENDAPVGLSRDLGLLDITMIGVGAMIGAGIFVLTGIAAGRAGPALLLAFALNGLIAVIIGAAYAELGSCFPEAGGGYLWVRQGMSEVFGFLSGWMSWFAHAVACSLYALGFGSFTAELLKIFFGTLPIGHQPLTAGIAAAIALAFVAINYRGSSETGKIGNIVTSIKLFILLVLAGFGLAKMFGRPDPLANLEPFLPEGVLAMFVAMGLTFIAFEGYEIIAQSGEEVKDPAHNIPRAIFLSIGISVAVYLVMAFVVLGALDAPAGMPIYKYLGTLGELGMAEAADQFMPYGKIILLLAGMASTMSALNATIYSSSRVSFAMGRDGNLPFFFGRIHPVLHTPHVAIFISGGIIIGMALLLPIQDVAASADIMFLLLFMMVCYSLITLRKLRPDLPRQFVMPFYPYLPWLGVGVCLLLSLTLLTLSPIAWLSALLWIGSGLVLYVLYSSKNLERLAAQQRPILLEEVVAVAQYSVMIPVRDMEQARSLGELGATLAAAQAGELFALHVIRVPRALTIMEGRIFLRQARPILEEAIACGKAHLVPVHTMLRLGRNIAHTIIDTAQQRNANLMLLGWPGYSASHDVAFGSVIDLISANPPCDLALVRLQRPWQPPKRILIPLRGKGVHVRMAFDMAHAIAGYYAQPANAGQVVGVLALHVRTARSGPEDLGEFRAAVERLAQECALSIEPLEVEAINVAQGIIEASEKADLVIMGASDQGFFEQRLFGNIPEQVMQQSPSSIIMCKRYQGPVASWLRRHLFSSPVSRDGAAEAMPADRI